MRWQGGYPRGCLYQNRLLCTLENSVNEMAMEEMVSNGPSPKRLNAKDF